MDFLGNNLEPGSIVLMSGTRASGFNFGVISKIGRGRVQLVSCYYSRKDVDNIVVVTEEQYIHSITQKWIKQANAEGNIVRRIKPAGMEIQEITTPAIELAYKEYSKVILISRRLRGVPLEEYEQTLEEMTRNNQL